MANTLPVAVTPVVLGSHIVSMWVFLAVTLVETATVHSGFDFIGGGGLRGGMMRIMRGLWGITAWLG